jgi:hypothetical protein
MLGNHQDRIEEELNIYEHLMSMLAQHGPEKFCQF